MKTALIISVLIVSAAVLFLLSLVLMRTEKPDRERLSAFLNRNIAHRGLYNLQSGIPENSLAAFEIACARGFAIELDVQLTRDGHIVVFHDFNLKRMCGINKKVRRLSLSELEKLSLNGTEHKIPTFSKVLETVNGRVPLLIELKIPNFSAELCRKLDRELKAYRGDYAVQSFNPVGVRWYMKNRPEVTRGQLSGNIYHFRERPVIVFCFVIANLLTNFFTKPHFISYQQSYSDHLSFRLCKKFYSPITFGWTARNESDYLKTSRNFDAVIFDTMQLNSPFIDRNMQQ